MAPDSCGLEQSKNAMAPDSCGLEQNTSGAAPNSLVAAGYTRGCCTSAKYAGAARKNDSRRTLRPHQSATSPPTADGQSACFVLAAKSRSLGYWNSRILRAPAHGRCCCLALPTCVLEKHYSLRRRQPARCRKPLKADGSETVRAGVDSWPNYFPPLPR
jgi:hypothetical protein